MVCYKVEIRKRRGNASFNKNRYPDFRYDKTGKYAYHWERLSVGAEELVVLKKRAKQDGFEVRATPMNLIRSSTYRQQFFEENPGPYRCCYCHRKLNSETFTVDHLVAVAKAKKSLVLKIMRADGINDPVNLVAACTRCNRRKGAKGGLWVIRGLLGRYKAYWVVYYAVYFVLVTLFLGLFLYPIIIFIGFPNGTPLGNTFCIFLMNWLYSLFGWV